MICEVTCKENVLSWTIDWNDEESRGPKRGENTSMDIVKGRSVFWKFEWNVLKYHFLSNLHGDGFLNKQANL